jgi:hypothetical protein
MMGIWGSIIAGLIAGYILHILKGYVDYRADISRRRLAAYEEYCRKSLLLFPQGNGPEVATGMLEALRPVVLYCSQEAFDKIQDLQALTIVMAIGKDFRVPSKLFDSKEYLLANEAVILQLRKEIFRLRLRRQSALTIKPEFLRNDIDQVEGLRSGKTKAQ